MDWFYLAQDTDQQRVPVNMIMNIRIFPAELKLALSRSQLAKLLKSSGHCMYRTVVTICTAQWSLYVPHSGHYMYLTLVTICTTSLTFTIPRSAHTAVFMCFVWISEQTAIISLYNIN